MASLYREEILDHYKHPRNFGVLDNPTVTVDEDNSTCGDQMKIALKVHNGVLAGILWSGSGCALSMAGASMLSEYIKGKKMYDIESITESDILQMMGGTITQGRINCALLCLRTLQKGLKVLRIKQSQKSSPVVVNKEMNISELVARWPETRMVLSEYNLHCVGCHASSFDTLEAGAKVHGMSEDEINQMMDDLNLIISDKKQ
ncbi:MAG: iron-sulfur cluster assembly scaffold protein [Patescibacteria group bacterium]